MSRFAFLSDSDWRRSVLMDGFGKGFWGFFGVAVATGVLCWALEGPEAISRSLARDAGLLGDLMPRVLVALSIAALIWFLLPRHRISALVGQESGLLGLIIATAAGAVTPGGPSSAYALLAVLAVSGADRGALIAYITSWATLGLQRILVWDVPFMGAEFAFLRLLISLPLPVLAGLIARRLPFDLRVKDDSQDQPVPR
ncbi:hypothetical protein LCGC14_1419810 [marine sediment metagenome]|uniref:Permease n=1 Tax=marine sediment metagenome TaxID=412755 RepID=A0A0F9JS56_9ZZZZ